MRFASVAACVLLGAAPAHAFVPEHDGALIVAAGAPARRTRGVDPVRSGGWDAIRDRDTGVIARMWGGHEDAPGAQADAAIAEAAARSFLARHLGELAPGARPGDFVLAANRVDGHLRTVAFFQTWNGMRVVGGQLHVVFGNDRIFAAGSEALPNVHAALPRSRTPAAVGRAAAWMRTETREPVTARATGTRVVLPIVHGPADIEYRVADVLDAAAGRLRWDVYVAPDGAPLARQSRVHFADSTLRFDVGQRYAAGPRADVDAGQVDLTVDGAPTTTGVDGSFTWPTAVAATVVPSVVGTIVKVIDEAGALASATLTAQPGQPVVWSMATDEMADAQLSGFIYATQAKAVGARIMPTLAWLAQQLEVHVNIDDSCNAFSVGDAIYFFRADATCENTARLADVVYHELGHSFHAQTAIPGVGGSDFSIVEGYADFFAASVTGDSAIGRGFHFTAVPVRELDPIGNEKLSPRDVTPISHTTGLIIGGAMFDLRKQLIAKLGPAQGIATSDKIFLGLLQRAPDLTVTYMTALLADDDDADLSNGTPNSCVIESAFGRHGLAGPEFRATSVATPVVDGRRISVAVDTPTGTACPPTQVTAMHVVWHVGDGAPQDLAMTATPSAQGATWSAELPEQPDGTVVTYQVVADLDTAETVLYPDNPADPEYQLFVGTATEIWCEHFDADPGWKQDGAVEWDVGVSNPANFAAGDPATAFAGTSWLGTDLRGDGRYRADILTSIDTPAIDVSRYEQVHLQFRRWLVIEDGGNDVATVRVNGTQLWANTATAERSLDHVDKEWRFVDLDVTAFKSLPITATWTLASDPTRNLGGWNLDEICLVGLGRIPSCGDGVLDPGEQCDDGNLGDGDACSATCELDHRNDDGGCCSTGGDPTGPVLLGFGLLALARKRRRRRSA